MIERFEGHVEKMSVMKHIGTNLDLCELQIDFDTLKIFYDANELMKFIDKDVMYTVRPDVIEGREERVVCELALLSTIQTVASSENIKLIPEGTRRTTCNLEARTIRFGEFYPNVIALMSKYELGSSSKAKWFDCTMIDSVSKEFVVRLFATNVETEKMEEILKSFIGGYVNFDLESTKYGYQTKEIVGLPNDVEESPEVVVAKTVVQKLIDSDQALRDYCARYDFVNVMSDIIDGEPGYGLVRMASEIYMINAIDNISTDLDIRAMKRAVICSRGHMLPRKVNYSKPILNTNKAMQIPELRQDAELMFILDVLTEEEASSTKLTYLKIRGLVDDIIKIRRGISNEKDLNAFASVMSAFNGLL